MDYSLDQLHLAARLYYVDHMPQAEIARFIKVSQPKISRLLNEAREHGIVCITVADYDPRSHELEQQLIERWGLVAPIVIKTPPGSDDADLRRVVARLSAPVVAEMIKPQGIIGVSGGRMIREMAQVLPEKRTPGVTVIQTMGSIDATVGPVDALEVGRMIANRCAGSFITLNTPALVPDKKTRDSFVALGQIRSVLQKMSQATLALIGIGTLSNSAFAERGVIAPVARQLEKAGAVGEICGRFFNRQGKECDTVWRDRVISIEFDQLRRIPEVVALVIGVDRVAAIAAAIRGGLIKSIVMDADAAQALVNFEKNSNPKNCNPK